MLGGLEWEKKKILNDSLEKINIIYKIIFL